MGCLDLYLNEPILVPFEVKVFNTPRLRIKDPNSKDSKKKMSITDQKLAEIVRECIEVRKLSLTETVLVLGVSPTPIRRICRTLKIGRYREQIPSDIRSKSSQVPYGWNSVNGFLEKNPGEWIHVEQMQQFRLEGRSFHWIAAEMARLGVKTKNRGKWFANTVSQILRFNFTHFPTKTNT